MCQSCTTVLLINYYGLGMAPLSCKSEFTVRWKILSFSKFQGPSVQNLKRLLITQQQYSIAVSNLMQLSGWLKTKYPDMQYLKALNCQ